MNMRFAAIIPFLLAAPSAWAFGLHIVEGGNGEGSAGGTPGTRVSLWLDPTYQCANGSAPGYRCILEEKGGGPQGPVTYSLSDPCVEGTRTVTLGGEGYLRVPSYITYAMFGFEEGVYQTFTELDGQFPSLGGGATVAWCRSKGATDRLGMNLFIDRDPAGKLTASLWIAYKTASSPTGMHVWKVLAFPVAASTSPMGPLYSADAFHLQLRDKPTDPGHAFERYSRLDFGLSDDAGPYPGGKPLLEEMYCRTL